MDGNGSRSNDDACSKQFNRQRHEGYVAMLARLDYENLIQVNQAEVSEQVGMNRHNVNRSIKKLIELGVILEGVKIGISRSYRLNPNFGWKGSAKGHREALHEHLKVIKDKGAQGAWGSFSDTADMRPPITRQPQGYTELALCLVNPKPLNECLRHIFPYCATPKGLVNTVGAAHTRVRHVAGVQGNLLHPYHRALSPPTCKGQVATRLLRKP